MIRSLALVISIMPMTDSVTRIGSSNRIIRCRVSQSALMARTDAAASSTVILAKRAKASSTNMPKKALPGSPTGTGGRARPMTPAATSRAATVAHRITGARSSLPPKAPTISAASA